MEKIEEFLRGLCATLAAGKMYPVSHPQFRKVIDATYENLSVILKEKGELIIGLIEDEIVYENRVLFKLSKLFEILITQSKKKGIEKIYFYADTGKEELISFLSLLLSPEDPGDLEEKLRASGIEHIKASRLTTPDQEGKKTEENQLAPYESALKDLSQFYEKFAAEPPDTHALMQTLKLIMLNVRDKLAGKYHECLSLMLSGTYDEKTTHCLNTAILTVTTASKIGFSPDEIMAAGNTALLHQVNPKILLKNKDIFGILPFVVSFENNQRHLPLRQGPRYSSQPHVVSMLIALSGSYDNILRRGTAEITQEEIHRSLFKDTTGWVPPQLLDRFLKITRV